MKNALEYKGFIGSVQYSADDDILYGKIEGINDLVSYEGASLDEIKAGFQEAVDDYIAFCKQHDKPLFKSYRGSFNVRISEELHRRAVQKALSDGVSLNQLVQRALEREVEAAARAKGNARTSISN